MMIMSDSFNRIINEYKSHEDLPNSTCPQRLKENVFNVCRTIGKVRYLNHIYDYCLAFKNLSFDDFISYQRGNIVFDNEVFLLQLIQRSAEAKINLEQLKVSIQAIEDKSFESEQICSGHDFTRVLAICLKSLDEFEGKNQSADKVESSLRLSFSNDMFKEFSLYSKLNDLGALKQI